LDFDLELAKQQSSDNPVYYVQYAHARLASLFRVAQERQVPLPAIQDVDQTLLLHEEELRLIKTLAQYPLIIEGSAIALEPHRVTFYLQELAAQLHSFYNKHRVLPPVESSVKSEDGLQDVPCETNGKALDSEKKSVKDPLPPALTAARLALLRQVQTVLRNGLTLLGVSSPEKM
jgi:arginyl-tRNA synthetase